MYKGIGRGRGVHNLKHTWSALIAALGLTALSVNTAHADLVKIGYTSTTGTPINAAPGVGLINPASGVTFMVSGGIDRKLRIAVTANGAANPAFTKESATVLGANDVITYNGKTYYAQEFTSPKLADGKYTVKAEILASSGTVVQSDSVPLVIDTQGPITGTFAPRPYTQGAPVLSGEVWKLGLGYRDAPTYSSFVLDGFSDPSGIANVTAHLYRESGDIYKNFTLLFSEAGSTASIQYRDNFFPDSDLDEVFGLEFRITDKAGNISATKRQKVMFDNIGNAPALPFGVYDPSVTTELAPGLVGFVPYVAGASVKTNPIRLAWKIPKSNWYTYRQGGLNFTNSFGEKKVLGEDQDYVYLVASFPYRSENINYIRFYNFGEWGSQGTVNYDLELDPSAPQSPVIQNIEYYYSDKGWLRYSSRIVTPAELPIKITKVRYTAEPRPFAQTASHIGKCTIPVGQTQCEMTVNVSLNKGTTGTLHDQGVLTSADGLLKAKAQWANVWWNDLYYPILSYSYNASTMILTLHVNQPHQGDYLSNLVHKEAWLEDASGKKLSVTKTLTSATGENFEYEFDLKTLPEGTQDLVAGASEKLGAVSKIPLFVFDSDRTSPKVSVTKGESETINTLDKISFTVSDNKDPDPKITSILLTGGPAKESIALSYRKISGNTYGLEYPILFPTLEPGESYTLTVKAQDLQKNTGTGSTTFLYGPPMTGIIGHEGGIVNVPAVPTEFKRQDGSLLLNSEQLKLADGTPVSGVYDLLATLRSDAKTPLRISGVKVNPGTTVLLGQLDFTSTNGKISIPVVPVNAGAVGTNGVIISTSAPNSPVVYANIKTWMPVLNLEVNDEAPVQAMTSISVKVREAAGNICQFTTSPAVAKPADTIMAPVCLLEWKSIPRGLQEQAVTGGAHPMTQLVGRALTAGKQKIAYSIYVYNNKGTEKVLLTSSEQLLDVQPINASATFSHSLQGKPVTRVLEEVSLTMAQLSGPSCLITGDAALARSNGVAGAGLTCLIEFTAVPEGLATESLSPLELAGTLNRAGELPIRWTASVFDTTGSKLVVEQGQSTILVVNPEVTTSLSFKLNESTIAKITPTESHPDAWEKKIYSVVAEPGHGEVTATESGFTYTPAIGYVGDDQFTYKVLDVSGMEVQGVALATIEKFNYPPTMTHVALHTLEGRPSAPGVPVVEDLNRWDSHTFIITQSPHHGAATIEDGGIVYTPANGFFGNDSFTYSAIDQEGLSVEGRGVVDVSPFNLPPTAIMPREVLAYIGKGGAATLQVIDPNILDTHSVEVILQPEHGEVTLEGMRLRFRTTGSDNTSVLIRATDQDGLFVDESVSLKLIPQPRGNNEIRSQAPINRTP